MGTSKVRTLLTACVMIMLCAAMIVGGTYALWSDNVEVTNHLKAGTLKVSLYRTRYEKHTLGTDGYMTDTSNDTETDLGESTANVFGLSDSELIVPTATYAARLRLTNAGDVAIKYTVKLVVDGTRSNADLAKQLKVYIGTEADGQVSYDSGRYLASENTGGNVTYLEYTVDESFMEASTAEAGTAEKVFWVKVEFVDDTPQDITFDNDDAKDNELYFNLLVEATQKTAQATAQE